MPESVSPSPDDLDIHTVPEPKWTEIYDEVYEDLAERKAGDFLVAMVRYEQHGGLPSEYRQPRPDSPTRILHFPGRIGD